MKTFTLTEEDLVKIMRGGRGLKRAQAIALGLKYPPKSGWKKLVIGKVIDESTYNLLMDLKPPMKRAESLKMAGINPKTLKPLPRGRFVPQKPKHTKD